MSYCPHCGADVASSARFCSECGGDQQTTGANPLPPRSPGASSKAGRQPPSPRRILVLSMVSLPIWVALLYFVTQGPSSCSSTEGKLVASGEALGDFTLTPTQCRSGEHEQFFGVYLLPEANNKGGVKIVKDPTSGYRVTIEKPGSCKEDVCEVVEVTADGCETFKVRVVPTSTYVNDIRLLDGSLHLDCDGDKASRPGSRAPRPPTVKANITFESCD